MGQQVLEGKYSPLEIEEGRAGRLQLICFRTGAAAREMELEGVGEDLQIAYLLPLQE